MAIPVEIEGTGAQAKIRNPLGVIALGLVTLGVYLVFWYYFVNKEMAAFGKARNSDELGDSPGMSLLAVTLGALIIVPAFVSLYNTWKRLKGGEELTGLSGIEPGLGFVLCIFISPVGHYIFQSNWNKVLEAQAGGAAARQVRATGAPVSEPPPIPVA